jgi:hypothetical protein
MAFKFGEHDQVVTAYAQHAHGPGWANQPVWVVVRSRLDGAYRLECLQPEDLTREIWALYEVSQAAHKAMMNAVTAKIEKQKTKKGNAA